MQLVEFKCFLFHLGRTTVNNYFIIILLSLKYGYSVLLNALTIIDGKLKYTSVVSIETFMLCI